MNSNVNLLNVKRQTLVPLENIARINFILYVIETSVIAVGDDGLALSLELIKVVNDLTSEERFSIGNRGFVDDDLGSLSLDALHDALDGALAEIIAIRLHCQTVDTNDTHKRCMMDEV